MNHNEHAGKRDQASTPDYLEQKGRKEKGKNENDTGTKKIKRKKTETMRETGRHANNEKKHTSQLAPIMAAKQMKPSIQRRGQQPYWVSNDLLLLCLQLSIAAVFLLWNACFYSP